MSQVHDRSGADPTRRVSESQRKARVPHKTERLDARLTEAQKSLLERAAALAHQPLSDFVIRTATERAVQLIQEQSILELSARDSQVFAEVVLNPKPLGEKLKKAAERHDTLIAP